MKLLGTILFFIDPDLWFYALQHKLHITRHLLLV